MLHVYESEDKDAEDDEEGDDTAALPRVLGATPLQGEENADDGGHEEDGAEGIEALDAL